MAERITEIETPSGNTHTTVVTEGGRSHSGGILISLLVIAVLALAGLWFVASMSKSETAKDDAVAAAAHDVGNAAQNAGQAVENAAERVGN